MVEPGPTRRQPVPARRRGTGRDRGRLDSRAGQCWFCAWDGYGWDNIAPLTAAGQPPAAPPPDPCPASPSPLSLPAGPGDALARVEDWVTGWAEQAAADLFSTGETVITTSRGTVQAWLSRPGWRRGQALGVQASGDNGVTGNSTRRLSHGDDQEVRREVVTYLTFDLIGLVGG